MKEFKGTKGEWAVEDGSFSVYPIDLNPNCEIRKPVICRMHTGCYDYKNKEANAKLIAAAPELLTACNTAFDMCNCMIMPTEQDLDKVARELQIAINKALGDEEV